MHSSDGRIVSLKRASGFLAVVSALLIALLVAQVQYTLGPGDAPTPSTQTKRPNLPQLAVRSPAPDGTTANAGRTLFKSREQSLPIEAAASTDPVEAAPLEQFTLVAVMISSSGKIAVLRSMQSQLAQVAREGDQIGAWVLHSIAPNQVELDHNGQQTRLYLPDAQPTEQ